MNIEIRSVSTQDVKIAQKALESIGFKTIKEGDCCEAYWVDLEVPEKYQHIDCVVKEGVPGMTEKERRIQT